MRLTALPYFILKHKVDAEGLVMLSNAFEFIPAKSRYLELILRLQKEITETLLNHEKSVIYFGMSIDLIRVKPPLHGNNGSILCQRSL